MTAPRTTLVALIVAALLALALGSSASPAGAVRCVNLHAGSGVRAALRAAHRRHYPRAVGPQRGSVYYGRCGSTHWALASFSHPRFGYQDQPELFRRLRGHGWQDRGDTGGPDGACGRMPRALLRRWHIACTG